MITAVVPVAEIHTDLHSSSLIESVWVVFGLFWVILARFASFWLFLGSYGSFWVVLADSIV